MPRRNVGTRSPQRAKSAATANKKTSRQPYGLLRAEAERYYRDPVFREAMPWTEVPA